MPKLPRWFPKNPPIYDIDKTYLENAQDGPYFEGKIPQRILPPQEEWIDFLGFKLASPIGIPAGPLLTSKWIELSAALGFDLLTYKTIRSREHPAHSLPNMVFVKNKGVVDEKMVVAKHSPRAMRALAVTNSFGMPSKSPSFLKEDIPRALRALQKGQLLIVSVVGTSRPDTHFLDDFIAGALLAKDAGAPLIEANFSCPNVGKEEGSLYLNADTVYEIASALVRAIHPIPLILKMGNFHDVNRMRAVMIAAARSGVRAICGINTLSSLVVDERGAPALGPQRAYSGICGSPIRSEALRFVRDAAAINAQEKLGFSVMGCGGIVSPEHFTQFLNEGADIAMTATGMLWDPYLALRYHRMSSNPNKKFAGVNPKEDFKDEIINVRSL
jgi:dihydroorotate dehydrogenase (NAD+) catalytic subunit